MLTTRARDFLTTLERRPAVSTSDVEAIIRAAGFVAFVPWLEFHEKYAGYVEVIGRDMATWGLVHEKAVWLLPRRVEVDRETHEDTWYITCADAHPSYTYQLDDKGRFLGGPAESFDIHVERKALGWEFQRTSETRALTTHELRDVAFRRVFATQMKEHVVETASDCYTRYYMNDDYLVVEDVESGNLRDGWQHTERVEAASP